LSHRIRQAGALANVARQLERELQLAIERGYAAGVAAGQERSRSEAAEHALSEYQAKHTAIMKEADRRYDEQTADLIALREALERSRIALDDWLHVYAGDMCDPEKVAESVARISEAGATLAYIASVQKQNRAALAQSAERAEKGRSS
jgi:hypothetical protein